VNLDSLKAYIGAARWFGGKGREFEIAEVRRLAVVPPATEEAPATHVHLVEVRYEDGDTELYQVPLSFYTDPEPRLDHAFVGWWEEPELGWVHAYDALHDREAMAGWLQAFGSKPGGGLRFERIPGHDLDPEAPATLFSGEQSNSSVFFGEDSILKVFRKVTPGTNPDIAIHEVLTEAGSEHVAHLYGWVETDDEGDPLQLAMLQQFLRTATDGWELALASVRDLFAEADLHADEVGGDFAGESSRLGEALREVHVTLAGSFDTGTVPAAEVAAAMRSRLDDAVSVVPELASYVAQLRGAYEALEALGDIEVQRIHGDLHLGQTMRTVLGWKLVDFEGEPAKRLSERVLPDSPWRDVAGMMRSFDYAAHAVQRSLAGHDETSAHQRAIRAEEWAARNKEHFLTAYAGGDLDGRQGTMLAAYVADKAVYECVYETRNRPAWVSIPLEAVARIGVPS
jgi:maltokinase